MKDCVDQVGQAKYLSKFDPSKGYWLVPLAEHVHEIALNTGILIQSHAFWVAPATFQRLILKVLGDLEGCTVYLDDVVVFSDSWSDPV